MHQKIQIFILMSKVLDRHLAIYTMTLQNILRFRCRTLFFHSMSTICWSNMTCQCVMLTRYWSLAVPPHPLPPVQVADFSLHPVTAACC